MYDNLESKVPDSNAISQIFQFKLFSISLEKNLQTRFNDLKNYIDRLLVSNTGLLPATNNTEFDQIVIEAKKEFKESALKILNNLKEKFEQERRSNFVPERFLSQTLEDTKQHFFFSYNKLMQNLANLYPVNPVNKQPIPSQSQDNEEVEPPVRKKLKPGKTKFPKKARQILEAWYKAHADDPFPSHADKQRLADESGITVKQVKCWFINVRRKQWKKLGENKNFKTQIENKLIQPSESQAPGNHN